MSHTSICCLTEYSNDTVVTLKLVGEEKIILENQAVLEVYQTSMMSRKRALPKLESLSVSTKDQGFCPEKRFMQTRIVIEFRSIELL